MPQEIFIQEIQSGKDIVVLDVRTPAETAIFGMTLPGSMLVPVSQLFQAENLDRIPADRTVVVLCQSCLRSVAVGTALRHAGFDNVFVLKGGYRSLSGYLGPGQANP